MLAGFGSYKIMSKITKGATKAYYWCKLFPWKRAWAIFTTTLAIMIAAFYVIGWKATILLSVVLASLVLGVLWRIGDHAEKSEAKAALEHNKTEGDRLAAEKMQGWLNADKQPHRKFRGPR